MSEEEIVDPCNGCIECAMRCTAGIKMNELEFWRIIDELRGADRTFILRVLNEEKKLHWFEEIYYNACPFIDSHTMLCSIYSARPLICRVFGRVQQLPCPTGMAPQDMDMHRAFDIYRLMPRKTFTEWMAENEFFDYEQLLGKGEIKTLEI